MNVQIHSATGHSPYEVVFGQKPHSVLFPSGKIIGPLLEEELEMDGVTVECDPLKLNRNGQEHEKVVQNKGPLQEEGMAFNEEPMKLTEAEELFGSKIKRKWQKEEEDDAKRGENTSVDASGTGNDRWKNLASMEKHFEVKEYVFEYQHRKYY